MKLISLLLSISLLASVGLAAPGDEDAATQAVIEKQLPSYPLNKCVISGVAFSKKKPARNVVVNGRLIRVCCPDCAKTVREDPKAALAALDAAVIAAQKDSYPLSTCPVTGEKLAGDMGAPVDYVYGTRLVRFCCKGCVAKFKKDPAKYMAAVDKALIEAQKKTYPLSTCVVAGGELEGMGEPVDYLYGTRLVRFCCKGCVAKFEKEPAKFLALLDEARKTAGTKK